MARLITEDDVRSWAGKAGPGGHYILADGAIFTPGALDTARGLGIQVIYPGSALRGVLRQIAEEVIGAPMDAGQLAALEGAVLAKIKRGEG